MRNYRKINIYRTTCKYCNNTFVFNDDDIKSYIDDMGCLTIIYCPHCNESMRAKNDMLIGSTVVKMTLWDHIKEWFRF